MIHSVSPKMYTGLPIFLFEAKRKKKTIWWDLPVLTLSWKFYLMAHRSRKLLLFSSTELISLIIKTKLNELKMVYSVLNDTLPWVGYLKCCLPIKSSYHFSLFTYDAYDVSAFARRFFWTFFSPYLMTILKHSIEIWLNEYYELYKIEDSNEADVYTSGEWCLLTR